MQAPDTGLHKPFDRIVKALADEAPELLLRVFGVIAPGAEVTITPMRAETAPPMVEPDFVIRVKAPGRREFILHLEFQVRYERGVRRRMARYGISLWLQHDLRVVSILVLIDPGRTPKAAPSGKVMGRYSRHGSLIAHPFQVVRAWELGAGPVIDTRNVRLLPWAVLMKSTDAEVRELAALVGRSGDEEAIGRFLTLGSLRYHRDVLQEMLGGARMGLVELIMTESSLVREFTDRARDEGEAKGRAEGARRMLRRSLATRFPGLEQMPEIDLIANVDMLEALMVDAVLNSVDRAQAEQAVRAAASH